jgi:hypothetical protein
MSEKMNPNEGLNNEELNDLPQQIAKFAESDVQLTRRGLFDLGKGAVAALVAAKIATLIPAESEAKKKGKKKEKFAGYSPDNFTKVMWQELDPSDFGSRIFDLLDTLGLDRPPLVYKHNVKGKTRKNDKNIPTSSLVFELSKAFHELAKNKLKQVDQRKKMVPRIKEVASQPHRDYKRVMYIHNSVKQINDANKRTWNPLKKKTAQIMKRVQKMVIKEQAAAKHLKIASSADSKIYDITSLVPTAPNMAQGASGFDNFEEILEKTRPFVYGCVTGTSYNENARPQSDSVVIETAFMLRNVITVLYEAAYQRHKAFVNIKARADLLKNKGHDKQVKAKLSKFAKTKTTKSLRDGWAGLRTDIIEMIQIMNAAYKAETELARKIKRCKPQKRPAEKPYLDKAIETIKPQIHSGVSETPGTSDTPEEPAEDFKDIPETWY